MKPAVIYARVSSKDQEREGYSIPAQMKMLRGYAVENGFTVVREFVDVETAKMAGRKDFGEMVRFLEKTSTCRTVIAEKTDRLYRNLRDCLTLEDLNIEIHLPKEGQVISKEAKSQEKLIHGIHVVLARNYIENLREEVKKGCGRRRNRAFTQVVRLLAIGTTHSHTPLTLTLREFQR